MIIHLVNNILFFRNLQSRKKPFHRDDKAFPQSQNDGFLVRMDTTTQRGYQNQQHQNDSSEDRNEKDHTQLITTTRPKPPHSEIQETTDHEGTDPALFHLGNETEQLRLANNNKTTHEINSGKQSVSLEGDSRKRKDGVNPVVLNLTVKKHWFWKGRLNAACQLIKSELQKKQQNTILVQMKNIQCHRISRDLFLGEGNILLGFYAMRLAFARHGVQFSLSCQKEHPNINNSLIWHLQGSYPPNTTTPFQEIPKKRDTCRGMGFIPLQYASEYIRFDLRKLAVSIFGSREDIPESKNYVQEGHQSSHLLVSLDDVAIHFRCGDLLKGLPSEDYGFLKFQSYTDLIDPTASSIGIVTSSFNPDYIRVQDQGTGTICQHIVIAFQRHIQAVFPNATVSIHNGPNESIPVSYSRLIMAKKQTFTGPSTFGVFPAIASFGIGYIQKGNVNYFAPPIANQYDDVKMMTGTILTTNKIRKIGIKAAFQWMREKI